jgi:type I pantothenate kinase
MGDSYGEVVELIRREHAARGSPYLVSISGSVAAGKSWTAARLRDLLAGAGDLRVVVIGSDGFLFPNSMLDRLGLSARKGFPETYDRAALIAFLDDVRAGDPEAAAPIYSHLTYDVAKGALRVGRADVVILEGLALLGDDELDRRFDLAIFLDADEADLEAWFVTRFRELCDGGSGDQSSFYFRFAGLSPEQLDGMARAVWTTVNAVNLRDHILPARSRARIVIEKASDHRLRKLSLR